MGVTVNELDVILNASTQEYNRKISQSEKITEEFGEGGAKAFALISAGIAAAGVAIVKLGQELLKSIQDASKLQEANSKLNTVFKDLGNQADQTAKSLTSYGFSLTQANEILGSTGDVLTGLGLAQDEALKLSETVARLSQDLVSFTNYSGGVEGASQVLTKALLGERDALVGLGIKLNESELKARGYSDALSLQEKAQITLNAILEQSKNAIGDFGRTQDSLANQQRILEANLKDLSTTIGSKVLPVYTRFIKFLNEQFDRDKDLQEATSTLNDLLARRKQITDQLSGSVDTLTEADRQNLEVQKALIQNQIIQTLQDLTKEYNKFFRAQQTTVSGLSGTVFGRGENRAAALLDLEQKLNAEIQKRLVLNKQFTEGSDLQRKDLESIQRIQKEAAALTIERTQAEADLENAVKNVAKALKEGLITQQELRLLPEALQFQINAVANDPNFLKSINTQATKKMSEGGKKAGKAWKLSFLDTLQLKEEVGLESENVLAELNKYIKENQKYFKQYKKELLDTGKITKKRKEFLDEYLAVQQRITEELEKQKSEKFEKLNEQADELNSALETAGDLMRSFGGEATDVAKSLNDAGKKVTSSFGGYVAIIGGIIGTIVDMIIYLVEIGDKNEVITTEYLRQLDAVNNVTKSLNEQASALSEINGLIDNINKANALGIDLGVSAEKTIEAQLRGYREITRQLAELYGLQLNQEGLIVGITANDILQLTADTNQAIDAVGGLRLQLEGLFEDGKVRAGERDELQTILNNLLAAGAISQEAADALLDAGLNKSKQEDALTAIQNELEAFTTAKENELDLISQVNTANAGILDILQDRADLEKDLADDAAQKALEEQLKTEEAINDAIQERINLAKDYAQFVDIQNVARQEQLASQLRQTGLTGQALNKELQSAGAVSPGIGDSIGTLINNTYLTGIPDIANANN